MYDREKGKPKDANHSNAQSNASPFKPRPFFHWAAPQKASQPKQETPEDINTQLKRAIQLRAKWGNIPVYSPNRAPIEQPKTETVEPAPPEQPGTDIPGQRGREVEAGEESLNPLVAQMRPAGPTEFRGAVADIPFPQSTLSSEVQTQPSIPQKEVDSPPANQSLEGSLVREKSDRNSPDEAAGNLKEPIHTSSDAVQMNKELHPQAFTHSHDGKQLLAHELTHVVQQTGLIEPKSIPNLATKENK